MGCSRMGIVVLATGLAFSGLLAGCTTVSVGPVARSAAGGMDQVRAFPHGAQVVWYDYRVRDNRLVYLLIDAVPPERDAEPLHALLGPAGGQVLQADAAGVEGAAGVAGASEGVVLLRYPDGHTVATRVDAAAAGRFLARHRFQISEVTLTRTVGPFAAPRVATDIRPASCTDDATGLNLLSTLSACPQLQANPALRAFVRSMADAESVAAAASD